MKHILAPILLLTLLFPSLAFGETMKDLIDRLRQEPVWNKAMMKDLVERDGIIYKKWRCTDPENGNRCFSDVPFTGKVTGKAYNPFLWYYEKGKIRNGKREGPWVCYNWEGEKFVEWVKVCTE